MQEERGWERRCSTWWEERLGTDSGSARYVIKLHADREDEDVDAVACCMLHVARRMWHVACCMDNGTDNIKMACLPGWWDRDNPASRRGASPGAWTGDDDE
jgi:hypothetical protein